MCSGVVLVHPWDTEETNLVYFEHAELLKVLASRGSQIGFTDLRAIQDVIQVHLKLSK